MQAPDKLFRLRDEQLPTGAAAARKVGKPNLESRVQAQSTARK
jgi:hypothetical protein